MRIRNFGFRVYFKRYKLIFGMDNMTVDSNSSLQPHSPKLPGRKLFASGDMLQMLKNLSAVAKSSQHHAYQAQCILSGVRNIRSGAMVCSTMLKNDQPTRRVLIHSGYEIEYEINHTGLDQTQVHIVDIRLLAGEAVTRERAGLWNVKTNEQNNWVIPEEDDWLPDMGNTATGPKGSQSDPIKVGINGACKNIEHAAKMLPSHICRGDKKKEVALKQTGYQLFFTPPSKGILKSGWSFLNHVGNRLTAEDKLASRILANYMLQAHQKGLYVEWTSQRGGSRILTAAMEFAISAGVDLQQKQAIFLSDHTSSRYSADVARRKLNMDCSEEKWSNFTPGAAQLLGGERLGADAIACSAMELIYHTPKGERLPKSIDVADTIWQKGKAASAKGAALVTLSAAFGLDKGFAAALLNALGGTLLSSVPALNESYHSSSTEPLKAVARRLKELK